jgi:hypothetical protein
MTDQAVKDRIKAAIDQVRAEPGGSRHRNPELEQHQHRRHKEVPTHCRPDRGGRPTAEGARQREHILVTLTTPVVVESPVQPTLPSSEAVDEQKSILITTNLRRLRTPSLIDQLTLGTDSSRLTGVLWPASPGLA